MDITGKITKVLELQSGTSKTSGKEWQKQSFIVETDEKYNNLYCFELFGAEKVEDFNQRFALGHTVKVYFNVNCNEWQGKFYTSLSVWKIDGVGQQAPPAPPQEQAQAPAPGDDVNDMPF